MTTLSDCLKTNTQNSPTQTDALTSVNNSTESDRNQQANKTIQISTAGKTIDFVEESLKAKARVSVEKNKHLFKAAKIIIAVASTAVGGVIGVLTGNPIIAIVIATAGTLARETLLLIGVFFAEKIGILEKYTFEIILHQS